MSEERRVSMPRLGESIVEATLVKWRVKVKDTVARGQILAEVETDKATNEIPAPRDGVIASILVEEGQTVAVGTPLLELEGADGRSEAPKVEPASQRLPTKIFIEGGGPPHNSPAVRRLAREHALDLGRIAGTGKNGRVTREDVLRSLDKPSVTPVIARAEATPFETVLPQPIVERQEPVRGPIYHAKPGDRVVPFSRRRKAIAQNLLYSLETSAHVFALAEIDMSRVIAAKNVDAIHAERAGLKLTFMPYVVQAVARALAEHPELNATVQNDALILRAERNVGVAVDTKEGLVVPVIRRADELALLGLARQLQELSDRARSGKLSADDMSGGSFTISNPGKDGNLVGLSIIRQPEVAILRMGSIVKRAVVREIDGEDVIVVRPMMFAALSYDHRVIDGRLGNAFLHRVSELISSTRPALAV
jgi:pyruvate/2-oxoglutarate dehydrogenase complex dihydrolipoamide acyltransferase (E2) component